MALNINKTANQINEFANEFKKSYSEHFSRVNKARTAYIDLLGKRKNGKLNNDYGYKIDFTGFA